MPRRILVIDDNLDHLHSLALLLRQRGHEVEYAINATAALRIVERFRPDIAFLDMMLPDCEGPVLSNLLHLKHAPLRVVAVSGNDTPEMRSRAVLAGCEDYLLKPLDIARIERLVA